jgi:hypothetical protein
MPREPLDAPEDLPKQAPRQVALGQLEDKVPRMPDEAPARLEQALLQARQVPTLDGERQDEPPPTGESNPADLAGSNRGPAITEIEQPDLRVSR